MARHHDEGRPRTRSRAAQQGGGQACSLLESHARQLILEARRIGAVVYELRQPYFAGTGENFWPLPPLSFGRAGAARRPGAVPRARRSALCAPRAGWEAAHTVWIWPDRSPSAGVLLAAARKDQARPDPGDRLLLARRGSGAGRRARRYARPHAGRPAATATCSAKMANAIVHDVTERAYACRPPLPRRGWPKIVVLSDFLEPDRGSTRHLSATLRHQRARPRRSRSSIQPRTTFPSSTASSSSVEPKGASRRDYEPEARQRPGRASAERASRRAHRCRSGPRSDQLRMGFTHLAVPTMRRARSCHRVAPATGAPAPGAAVGGRLPNAGLCRESTARDGIAEPCRSPSRSRWCC